MHEILPFVAERYGNGARAVLGKSSGGFGAWHLSLEHPRAFRALVSISADCGFDQLFPGEFLTALRELQGFGGEPARFLEALAQRPELGFECHALANVLAMCACYSPNPEAPLGFDLPFELHTGELRPAVWERWLRFDPLRRVERQRAELADLAWLYLECGLRDEHHLQWSTRRLAQRLRALSIPCEHVEHPGGHRGIDGRFPPLLARLASALQG
jgi:enterochelin esterase family protein